jgi:hypothetical protein
VQQTGLIIVERKMNVNIIIVHSCRASCSRKRIHPYRFPISAQKMFPHTYVIWLGYLSTLRLGEWGCPENFFSSL